MTVAGAGALLTEPDQTVLSVSGGMVERTLRLQPSLDQIRHRKCQPVVICLLSAGAGAAGGRPSRSPPSRPPPRLGALGSPWESSIDALSQQTTVKIVQQLRPGGRVVAPRHRVLVAVRRRLHLLRVDQERRGLRGEVRGGGRSHALTPPRWERHRTPPARSSSCPPPGASHLQLLNHWKVFI